MDLLLLLSTILLLTFSTCFLLLYPLCRRKTLFLKTYTNLPALVANLYGFPPDFSKEVVEYTRFMRIPGRKVLFTADPVIMQYTSCSNLHDFHRGANVAEAFDPLGHSIFNMEGNEWETSRKIHRICFNIKEFTSFSSRAVIHKVETSLIEVLNHFSCSNEQFDLQDVFQRLSFDLICHIAHGTDPKILSIPLIDSPESTAVEILTEGVVARLRTLRGFWKLQRSLGIGKEKRMVKAVKILSDFCYQGAVKLKEGIKNGTAERYCLGASFMTESEDTPDLETIRDEFLGSLLAGKGTVSATLTWLFWAISEHPSAVDKIREEIINSVQEDEDVNKFRLFSPKELSKLVYLQAAVCETLRLYPPVPMICKGPYEPRALPTGHLVDRNTIIWINFFVMGRLESLWGKDSMEFKPERWITEKGALRYEPAHKFPAFNAGPRICLGKDLAFLEVKAVAAAIIHNYNVSIPKGQDTTPTKAVISKMKDGLRATISKRWP